VGALLGRRLCALPAIRAAARPDVDRFIADAERGALDAWGAAVDRTAPAFAALQARTFSDADDLPTAAEIAALPPAEAGMFPMFAALLLERGSARGPAFSLAVGLPGARAALASLAETATGEFGGAVRAALAAPRPTGASRVP